MSDKVRLIFRPDVAPPLGYIPHIDMMHPLRPAERVLPDIQEGKDEKGNDAFFFDLEPMVARHILERDSKCYKLWAPAEMKIVVRDTKGAHMVTARSVDPSLNLVIKTPKAPVVVLEPKKEDEAESEAPVVTQIVPPVSAKEAAEKISKAAGKA